MFLRSFLIVFPLWSFGQQRQSASEAAFNIHDYSNSRFDIDSNGFHGSTEADTSFYTNGKLAKVEHFAVAKNSRTSGHRFGSSTTYYPNGQIKAKGHYEMCSLLSYESPKRGRRLEHSYKVGKWVYYYENGQVKAIGTYEIMVTNAVTGVAGQYSKTSKINDLWSFFDSDGNSAKNKGALIAEIEHNPNCD